MNSLEDRNSLNESQLWDFTPRGRQTGSVTFADSQYDEAEEILTTRSQKQRGLRPSEFQPVQVGGYAAYYNKDKGVQPRTRIPHSLDPDARGTKATHVLKFKDDPKYKPFLLMLEHGIPLAAVWDRCIEAKLDPAHLLDDAEGPAIHQVLADPEEEEAAALALFAERAQADGAWRAHGNDWHAMQRSSVGLKDTPLLPRNVGLLQQQRVERSKQAAHAERGEQRAQEGHKAFLPMHDDINKVTAGERQVSKMRRNHPHVFSTRPIAYKPTGFTGVGAPVGNDVWGNSRPGKSFAENEFWRNIGQGSLPDVVGSYGATVGGGGYSLATESRVPVTWKTEEEVMAAWNKKTDKQ